MSKLADKRTVDMQVIGDWVEPGARVLDLGCGRGVMLAYLKQAKSVRGVGVDMDFGKILGCVQRGVTAYQGDMLEFMRAFPAGYFDRVICSRTIEELPDPAAVLAEALRVGRALAVGFVNHGYWKNRLDTLVRGQKPANEIYTTPWHRSRPANPVSIADFEAFCADMGVAIRHRVLLRGDWKRPCNFLPNLLAGYAVYDLGNASPAPH